MSATAQRPFGRAGMHKLECPACNGYCYSTVASLEQHGIPSCGCGERYEPARVELAMLLGVECAAVAEFMAECSSVAHGQAWTGRSGLADPSVTAHRRVESRRQVSARARRIAALVPAPEAAPF